MSRIGGSGLAASAQIYCNMWVGQLSDGMRKMDEFVLKPTLPACAPKVPCWLPCW